MPTAAAIGEATQRAANAHESEKNSGKRGAPHFRGIGRGTQLRQAERRRVADDDKDQNKKTALRQWPKQRRLGARGDAPRPRAAERRKRRKAMKPLAAA